MSFVKGNLLTLILSWVLMQFAFSLVYPFESPYVRELGASPLVLGLMGSLGAALLCIVSIPGAYIADRYGRKQIIVIMTYGVALSYLFYAFAPSWHYILVGIIIGNICFIYQPALQAIQADSIPPQRRGIGFAASHVIPSIATIPSPAIGGFLVENYGLVPGMRIAFGIVVIAMLSAAILRMLFLKETIDRPEKIKLGGLKNVFKESIQSTVGAWKLMPRSLTFLTLALVISVFGEPMFHLFAALYVIDVVGVSAGDWGLVLTVSAAISLIAGIPLGKVVDIIGRKRSIILAYLLFTPASVLFIFSTTFLQLLIAFSIFALGGMLMWPAFGALQADMIPRYKRGRIMGSIGILNLAATIPSSAIGGFLYETNPAAPFIMVIILGAISTLIIALLVKEPDPEKREE
jgi:MFS family permease